jgi:hypothetical protein
MAKAKKFTQVKRMAGIKKLADKVCTLNLATWKETYRLNEWLDLLSAVLEANKINFTDLRYVPYAERFEVELVARGGLYGVPVKVEYVLDIMPKLNLVSQIASIRIKQDEIQACVGKEFAQ